MSKLSPVVRPARLSPLTFILILLTLTSSSILIHPAAAASSALEQVPGQPPETATVGVWSDTYQSSNITDTTLTPTSLFTIEINATNAPAFNGYELFLYYDPNILQAQSIDFTTGTVFTNPFVVRRELAPAGTVRIVEVNLGSAFKGTTGTLAHVSFKVLALGVSPLTLAAGLQQPSTFAQEWTRLVLGDQPIDTAASDGYFGNIDDKSGPIASFTTNPALPQLGDEVVFDASASFDPDDNILPDRGIARYLWDFGHGFATSTIFPLIVHRFTTRQGHVFSGDLSIRLTVLDTNNGFLGMKTMHIRISQTPRPPRTFNLSTSRQSPLIISPGSSNTLTVSLATLFGFNGLCFKGICFITVKATVTPQVRSGPTVSLSPSTVITAARGTADSTLTVSTLLNTPPGRYVIVLQATSGQQQSWQVLLFLVVRPLEPVFIQLTWIRRLSLAANANTQTWTSKVTNPNTHIDLQIRILTTGIGERGSPAFTVVTGSILLHGGETRPGILTTSTFTTADIGTRFLFTAVIIWTSQVTDEILASASTRSGSFLTLP